jgi:hypothetical protein
MIWGIYDDDDHAFACLFESGCRRGVACLREWVIGKRGLGCCVCECPVCMTMLCYVGMGSFITFEFYLTWATCVLDQGWREEELWRPAYTLCFFYFYWRVASNERMDGWTDGMRGWMGFPSPARKCQVTMDGR